MADSSSAPAPGLTPEQVAFFNANGYLVIERWWDAPTVAKLKAEGDRLLDEYELPAKATIFTTDEQTRTSDAYFLRSGGNISYFFEKGAFNAAGELVIPKQQAINKIGHALHELNPVYRAVSLEDPRVAAIFRTLGYEHPVVPQSMLICKPAGIGGEVRPHVDGAFLYTEPQSCLGLWWPLEHCTTSNGCLWAVPGSHVHGVKRRFKRNAAGTGTEFEPPEEVPFETAGAVPLEIPAGSLVLIHCALVHFSHANTSAISRHAYSIHAVEGGKGVVYPRENWLQRDDGSAFPALY